jgi:hypothetical protein
MMMQAVVGRYRRKNFTNILLAPDGETRLAQGTF